jgi:uncharacterized membrane protein YebE (DUF533 family)
MNINSLLNSIMGSTGSGINKAVSKAKSGSMPGGLIGGAAAGGLAAMLLTNKKARKMGGKAIKYGGLAAVGGMAYKAWRDHQANQTPTQSSHLEANQSFDSSPMPTAPAGSIFDLAEEQPNQQTQNTHVVLIKAMISAAKADGHIDASERARIEEEISNLGISTEEQKLLIEQLRANSDPIAIARLSDNEALSAEIYLVSMLAIDIDTEEERRYLERLGDALRLPNDLRQKIAHEVKHAQTQ